MLKIRFRRTGKKNNPNYRIVVAEHTAAVNGKFIDKIGHYNPHTKETVINKDKALDWINKGATPSNSVAKLLVKEKVSHNNISVKTFTKRPPKKEVEAKEPTPVTTETTEKTEETPDVTATEESKDMPSNTETTATPETAETTPTA